MKATVLTGGVGGAKFVLGLAASGQVDELTAVVNTGDDFRHLGLHVSPDIDTLLYTLSGKDNKEQGWGREGESWSFLEALASLGGPQWFRLGDGDLALHILRTHKLQQGQSLSHITSEFARAWGLATIVLPMSDDGVATWLDTDCGPLPFQRYFVERRCEPKVSAIRFEGAAEAKAASAVLDALRGADVVFVAPSNPYLSIDPILAVADIATAMSTTSAPIVVVSPIVGGKAVKGPTTKLMAELGLAANNDTIASHYAEFADAMLYDESDEAPSGLPSRPASTLMRTRDDKIRVACDALRLAQELR